MASAALNYDEFGPPTPRLERGLTCSHASTCSTSSTPSTTSTTTSTTSTTTAHPHIEKEMTVMKTAPTSSCGEDGFHDLNHLEEPPLGVSDIPDWDTRMPFWCHAVAGSCAGVTEHALIYPLDTIKTNLQVYRSATHSISTATAATAAATSTTSAGLSGAGNGRGFSPSAPSFLSIYRSLRTRGLADGFFRGSLTIVSAAIPAHVGLFCVYEFTKKRLISDSPTKLSQADIVPRAALCGALGTLTHDLVLTPADVVKQRMQLRVQPSVRTTIRALFEQEGGQAFYRSLPVTLMMNLPYGSIMVAGNEWGKSMLGIADIRDAQSVRDNIGWFFLSAGLSGACAAICTQPLDVLKTRLQTQDCMLMCGTAECPSPPPAPCGLRREAKYTGIRDTVTKIVRQEGYTAFFRGAQARAAICMPSAAISWGTYEAVKSLFWEEGM